MVQARHQKSKSKSKSKKHHVTVKKQGKQADVDQFRGQLDGLGLKIVQLTADGNCFFRALADQLEGNEEEHRKYRLMVVQHIMKHQEQFEPFIEDEVPFDDYCKSMEEDGTWAGHMELQAASLVTRSNICIHRIMSPRWYIRNFDDPGTHMIHLSYHDGEHYNSIRLKEDDGSGPAKLIVIKADSNISATSNQTKNTATRANRAGRSAIDAGSVKVVMSGTGCQNANKVEQVLQELDGDVAAAIEYLQVGADEYFAERDEHISQNNIPNDCHENGSCEQPNGVPKCKTSEQHRGSSAFATQENGFQNDKSIPRNKLCPCGSRKKYKACCGSGKVKPSADSIIFGISMQEVNAGNGKKGKKESKQKGEPMRTSASCDCKAPSDMGALCI